MRILRAFLTRSITASRLHTVGFPACMPAKLCICLNPRYCASVFVWYYAVLLLETLHIEGYLLRLHTSQHACLLVYLSTCIST